MHRVKNLFKSLKNAACKYHTHFNPVYNQTVGDGMQHHPNKFPHLIDGQHQKSLMQMLNHSTIQPNWMLWLAMMSSNWTQTEILICIFQFDAVILICMVGLAEVWPRLSLICKRFGSMCWVIILKSLWGNVEDLIWLKIIRLVK